MPTLSLYDGTLEQVGLRVVLGRIVISDDHARVLGSQVKPTLHPKPDGAMTALHSLDTDSMQTTDAPLGCLSSGGSSVSAVGLNHMELSAGVRQCGAVGR